MRVAKYGICGLTGGLFSYTACTADYSRMHDPDSGPELSIDISVVPNPVLQFHYPRTTGTLLKENHSAVVSVTISKWRPDVSVEHVNVYPRCSSSGLTTSSGQGLRPTMYDYGWKSLGKEETKEYPNWNGRETKWQQSRLEMIKTGFGPLPSESGTFDRFETACAFTKAESVITWTPWWGVKIGWTKTKRVPWGPIVTEKKRAKHWENHKAGGC